VDRFDRPRAAARRAVRGFTSGHKRAAAAALSLEDRASFAEKKDAVLTAADDVLGKVRDLVFAQIPDELTALDLMTPAGDRPGISVRDDATVETAKRVLSESGGTSLFVVDSGTDELKGQIKLNDLVRAEKKRELSLSNPNSKKQNLQEPLRIKALLRTELTRVRPSDSLAHLDDLLQDTGRLPVVNDDGRFLGIVTRTDILNAHNLYDQLQVDNHFLDTRFSSGSERAGVHAVQDDDYDDDDEEDHRPRHRRPHLDDETTPAAASSAAEATTPPSADPADHAADPQLTAR